MDKARSGSKGKALMLMTLQPKAKSNEIRGGMIGYNSVPWLLIGGCLDAHRYEVPY